MCSNCETASHFFQPLFKVSAQEKSLHRLSDEEIDKIKTDRPGGFSETEVQFTNFSEVTDT